MKTTDANKYITIKDIKTGEKFRVNPVQTTQHIVTNDAVRVRVHPHIIRNMVPNGTEFDGQTLLGPRTMLKV